MAIYNYLAVFHLVLVAILCIPGVTSQNVKSMKFVHYVQEGDDVTLSCSVSCENNNEKLYPRWKLQAPWYENAHLFQVTSFNKGLIKTELHAFDDYSLEFQREGIECPVNNSMFHLHITGVKTGLDHSVLQCGANSYFARKVMYIFVNKTVTANQETYYATPSGVRIECTHTCGRSSQTPITYLWRLRMLGHTHQEVLDLHNATTRASLEQELSVRVNMTAEGCEGNGNTSSFYLDIVGMSGRLQHALVTCGVRTDHQDLYSHTHSYIVINKTEVEMTKEVNEADEGEVVIECTHTCTGGAEPEYLWQLRTCRDIISQNLHVADVRSSIEDQLGIDISNWTGTCDGGNWSRRSFYLKMSGLGTSLNHSVVSCGVRQTNIYTVYSQQDSYILIKGEDETTPTHVTTPTKERHTTSTKFDPSDKSTQEPIVGNAPVFASSVAVVFIFGLVSGFFLAVIANFFKKTIFQACRTKTPESPTERNTAATTTAFQNNCYQEVPLTSPRSPAEFKIGQD